ncbi:hypothetical protein [Marinobacterium arenosum]|uniref:hypothetical protein n=1 Tax=Marinobacterium arenosum TaxID=2862496 RepID=UPI001C971B65|nr:hypothetical protein [Marinobacterium arenosum]MBY4675133.1 hypothetical protein [Marinobacterium arenosum]
MDRQLLIDRLVSFIRQIGLQVEFHRIEQDCFLPGILIHKGKLLVDCDQLAHPGDLLHEAGHLAVIPTDRRDGTGAYVGQQPAEEMAAIAWSWAALSHLQLPPEVVFHANGYKGASASLIDNFSQGHYLGVPILQWRRMSAEPHQAKALGLAAFPQMQHWLCP